MSVRIKVNCGTVVPVESDGSKTVNLYAVYSGSPENESFFKSTPSGYITFNTINQEAAAQFTQGKEYYIDITPAE